MENIRSNSGADSITEDHLNELLCSVLEEAKRMYEPVPVAVFPPMAYHASTASPYSNISEGEKWQEPFSRYGQRKESDGDSYSSGSSAKRQKTDKPKTKLT
jgi:DNTTIP1 dimerisation domain